MTATTGDEVTKLWLHSNNLAGSLPSSLGDLGSLDTLNLGKNNLTGAIPSTLGSASDLRVLFLQRNEFSGGIPKELGSLSELVLLNVRANQLTGEVPKELGGLANLHTLNLMENQLSGALPAELASLSSLSRFLVGGNASLCRPDDATFTSWLNGIQNTDALALSLCTPPPPEAPPTPSGLSLEPADASRTMTVSFGQVEGAVDENAQYRVRGREEGAEWTTWATVVSVTVEDGTVRGSTGEHTAGKAYEGQVRACGETQSDATCSAASESAFGATRASGPTGAAAAPGSPPQTVLTLSWTIEDAENHENAGYDIGYSADTTATGPETMLAGADVPAFTATQADISDLTADTWYRLFVRSHVEWGGTRYFESPWASATASTDAEETPPPASSDRGTLEGLHGATGGGDWTNSTNWLDSTVALDEWYGVTATSEDVVTKLWLHSNGLAGAIPDTLGNLASLDTLNLGSNQLSGDIPGKLASATNLRVLFLQRNQLTGAIPAELGALTGATLVNLSRNQLSGEIPAELGQLTSVTTLNLRNNQLTGALPTELTSLTALGRFYVANNSSLCRPDEESFTTWLDGIAQTDALELPVCEPPTPDPPAAPTNVAVQVVDTVPTTMTLAFDQGADATAENAQYRLRIRAGGGEWTEWATVVGAALDEGRVTARTGNHDSGTVYEVQVRACAATQSDETCSAASESAFGATAAPAPTDAVADTTSPPSQTALSFSWTIDNANGGTHAAYDIGFSESTTDTVPATMLDTASVPSFAETEVEIAELEADTEYRLFVRSHVAFDGTRYHESPWQSATARTEAEPPPPSSPDRATLVELYNATGGSEWTTSTHWTDSTTAVGQWHGVSTDSLERVTSLALSSNNLAGTLPASLGTLAEATSLALDGNDLSGAVPSALADLSNLRELLLHGNGFSGSVPGAIGNLQHLERLGLSNGDEGEGRLPIALTSLDSLRWFHVDEPSADSVGLCRPNNADFDTWLSGIDSTNVDDLRQCTASDLTDREILTELYHSTRGNNWSNKSNWLTDAPLGWWHGVDTNSDGEVTSVNLNNNGLTGTLPASIGGLESLTQLVVSNDGIGGTIPSSLADLRELNTVWIAGTDVTGQIPAGLGHTGLKQLYLHQNNLTGSLPPDLLNSSTLTYFTAVGNNLTGSIPPVETDDLPLGVLKLGDNRLSGSIPTSLGSLSDLSALLLHLNRLSGPLPSELGNLSRLEALTVQGNSAMAGSVPATFTALTRLREFRADKTGICLPDDQALRNWWRRVKTRSVELCPPTGDYAYLTQAIQSTVWPVSLIAGRKAALRAFVTAPDTTTQTMPSARATFFVNGLQKHVADIPAGTSVIPVEIDEGDLASSIDVLIPDSVIQPGLEMVVEIDPDGTVDSTVAFTRRIPAEGRQAVEVQRLHAAQITLIPFLSSSDPDSSLIAIVDSMVADPLGHRLFAHTRNLMPFSAVSVTAHEPVTMTSDWPNHQIGQIQALRILENGTGHYHALAQEMLGVARQSG